MKILLVELSTHASVLRYCANSLRYDHKLTICSSDNTLSNSGIDEQPNPISLGTSGSSVKIHSWSASVKFPYLSLLEWRTLLSAHEHVIFTTEILSEEFFKALVDSGTSYSVFVHNANSSLSSKPPVYWSMYGLGSLLKNSLNSENTKSSLHAKMANGLVFPSVLGVNYATSFVKTSNTFGYPWAISDDRKDNAIGLNQEITKTRRVAVAGELDLRRRNLKILNDLFKIWDTDQPLLIDFVGPAVSTRGKRVLQELKGKAKGKLTVFGEGKWVEPEDYTNRLRMADVLVLNHSLQTRYGFVKEIGGKTKVSGIIHDAIRYQKRVFVNDGYHVSDEISGFVTIYKDVQHLKKLLQGQIEGVEQSVWSQFSSIEHRKKWNSYLAKFS